MLHTICINKTLSKILKSKLNGEKEIELYEYLEKIWFKWEPNFYNYNEIFENQNLENKLPHFFETNNIAEIINNYY